ncbi:MAG: DUF3726 domain-containing protein [Pseudomonadota bacterium]
MTAIELSQNEFSSAIQKACRSIGTDPALATDIANACLFLEASGLPSLSHLLPLLDTPTKATTPDYLHSQNGYFARRVDLLQNGGSAMDHLSLATLTVQHCDSFPLLAALLVSGSAAQGRFVRALWPGQGWLLLSSPLLGQKAPTIGGPITFRFVPPEEQVGLKQIAPSDRVLVDMVLWAALHIHAQKTYVPANDQTRLNDAGAGLTDND